MCQLLGLLKWHIFVKYYTDFLEGSNHIFSFEIQDILDFLTVGLYHLEWRYADVMFNRSTDQFVVLEGGRLAFSMCIGNNNILDCSTSRNFITVS